MSVAAGTRLRDEGIERAARSKMIRIKRCQIAFIEGLLARPDHTGTLDLATPAESVGAAFDDGGKWRGAVTAGLSRVGQIEKTGRSRPSVRPSAHRRDLAEWRLVDPVAARSYVETLRLFFETQRETAPKAATSGAVDGLTHTSIEDQTNG